MLELYHGRVGVRKREKEGSDIKATLGTSFEAKKEWVPKYTCIQPPMCLAGPSRLKHKASNEPANCPGELFTPS